MKVKTQYIQYAKDADFMFWEDESWGPGPGHIDWGAEYNGELNKFGDIIIKDLTQRLLDSRLITIPMAIQIYKDYGIEE